MSLESVEGQLGLSLGKKMSEKREVWEILEGMVERGILARVWVGVVNVSR